MVRPYRWRCPFCDHNAVVTKSNYDSTGGFFTLDNRYGPRWVEWVFVVCPNPECRKFTFTVTLKTASPMLHGQYAEGHILKAWQLIPPSEARVFPDYVPKAIREDYEEACLIRDLSPKASATLARRCLQGMIRDFWGVRKARLIDEIEEIKDRVDPLTWQAIDAVRSVGNIGAHMERDINVIVEVEPEEAAQLIGLIELLVRDWYINRHERQERLKAIVRLAESKEQAKSPPAAPTETPEVGESA